jgi:hypothetical protein
VVLVAGLTAACAGSSPPAQSQAAPAIHEHHAPHGGTLVELGEGLAHIELVLDRDAGTLTAYVLDGEAEDATRIQQATLDVVVEAPPTLAGHPLPLLARANVLTGETVGDSSEFVATSDALKEAASLKGRVSRIIVKGAIFENVPFEAGH